MYNQYEVQSLFKKFTITLLNLIANKKPDTTYSMYDKNEVKSKLR